MMTINNEIKNVSRNSIYEVDSKVIREYKNADKMFEQMVKDGLIKKRGNRLISGEKKMLKTLEANHLNGDSKKDKIIFSNFASRFND